MRVLVTGAGGYVGSALVPRLLAQGTQVVVSSRTPRRLHAQLQRWRRIAARHGTQVHVVTLDALDPQSVRAGLVAAAPLDAAYYLVHALEHQDYAERDAQAASTFAAAAAQAGVGRIVYLGGFVPDTDRRTGHLDSRADVGQRLTASRVETVCLQAAVIIGPGSTPFEVLRQLVQRLPVVPLPPFMRRTVQPIAIDDVIHYLAAAADASVLPAGQYDVAGERVTTYAGLARTFAAVAGLRRVFVPVPVPSAAVAARISGPLLPLDSGLLASLMPSLEVPMVSGEQRIRDWVPDPLGGLIGIEEAIARALGRTVTTLHP